MIERIDVRLDREYPIYYGAGAAVEWLVDELVEGELSRVVAVVSSEKVWGHAEQYISDLDELPRVRLQKIILPECEEKDKNLQTVEVVIDRLAELRMHRNGVVIALGGGVVGDIAGFAAAIYMRGVRLIQIPTTLLAQVDAAIGGKTGVNHKSGKNMIGAFYQPAAVICDTNFLKTLPPKEYCAGLAEVVKYGLLCNPNLLPETEERDLFVYLEQNTDALMAREDVAVMNMIRTSVIIKANIVEKDERETGDLRALLNLGHTFAHAVENVAGYGEWPHGEAVAAGLVAAAKLSEKIAGFPADDTKRIIALLDKFNLPVSFRNIDPGKILEAMQMDKKFTEKFTGARFVIMDSIGSAKLHNMQFAEIGDMVQVLREMCENETKP